MKNKYASLALALLLIICAAVQYNDPDFYIWMPVYLVTAFFPLCVFFDKNYPIAALRYAMFLCICLLYYIPDIGAWLADGLPNIAGSMKAESKYIELVREFFGLAICISVSIGHYFKWRIA